MPAFDIVFEKFQLAIEDDRIETSPTEVSPQELDEIEELRRFSAEINEVEPPSFTTT